jgi:N-acyl-D-aspartate/D-glutamate deacylase
VLDVVIRGGEVVDGSGASRRRADVGIEGGRVVAVGDDVGAGRRTIDADGLIVAPGFVDIHTHYDAQVFWDPYLTPSVLHGVTSVMSGNCGFTIAPIVEEQADYLRRLLARVEGIPLASLEAGLAWDWTSTEDYFGRLEGNLAINAGFMIGHSAIRRLVMGLESTQRAATSDEVEAMKVLLRRGLAAGGLGFSSSWSTAHTDGAGDPIPSRFADRDELVALSAVCAEFEGTSLEFSPALDWDDSAEIMTAMSAAASRPINWNLLVVNTADKEQCEVRLGAGRRAQEAGGRVVALTMPQPFVFRFSFRTGFLLNTIPGWDKPLALPPAELLALLRDPVRRREMEDLGETSGRRHVIDWANRRIVETFTPATKRYEGRLVADIAADEGKRPFDALIDIVCADDLATVFANIPPQQTSADWELQREVWRTGHALIGGSDAGAHLDLIHTFNLQTWFLDQAVRQAQVIELEEAIHYFTGAPASLYGLRDRGQLREGSWADVVIFDEHTVGSGPVHTRFDLPGGAGRLYAEATGISHVLVNGAEVVDGTQVVDSRPGRLLKSGRDTTTPSLAIAAW